MAQPFLVSRAEVRRVIAASSAGTVFEWYDFYLYAVLAPFFAKLFFRLTTKPPRSSPLLRPMPRAFWSAL